MKTMCIFSEYVQQYYCTYFLKTCPPPSTRYVLLEFLMQSLQVYHDFQCGLQGVKESSMNITYYYSATFRIMAIKFSTKTLLEQGPINIFMSFWSIDLHKKYASKSYLNSGGQSIQKQCIYLIGYFLSKFTILLRVIIKIDKSCI